MNKMCIVRFPVSEELLEAARKAGQEGVQIRDGRPVITREMALFLDCPLPPYEEENE